MRDDYLLAFKSTLDVDEKNNLIKAVAKISKNKDAHVLAEGVISQGESFKPHPSSKVQRELLSIHNELNHEVPMKATHLLAASSYFPKLLASCDRLKCGAHRFGKAHKKSWKSKSKKKAHILQHLKKC